MQQPLPICWRLLAALLVVLGLAARPAAASHLLGGEITYRYLDSDGPTAAPLRYELTLTLYNNCLPGAISPASAALINIYNQSNGTKLTLTSVNSTSVSGGNLYVLPSTQTGCITPTIPSNCTITGPTQPYILQRFVTVVNLPATTTGYYVAYTQGNRNYDITNVVDPDYAYLTLYSNLAPPATPNRSPVFSDIAVAVLCAKDTTFYLTNAIDADGDRLTYTFGKPYSLASLPTAFAPPPTSITYKPGYSETNPFGTGQGILSLLNVVTGVGIFSTPTQGKYVIAVDVKEYRTIGGVEQLIGTTRRDVQLVVAQCPNTAPPRLPAVSVVPRAYTVAAGNSVTFPIQATQVDGHPLTMTVRSELLDGPQGHNATFNGSPGSTTSSLGIVTTTGAAGSVGSNFAYTASCSEVRTTPYDVLVQVQDNGCAGKTVFDVFRVTVVKPTGPTAVAGDLTVCGANATASYTASGGTATGVTWTVTNGTIVGSNTANPVQVRWGTSGTGTITAQGSSNGCSADAVTRTVTIVPPATLAVAGPTTICPGSSTSLTVSGAPQGTTYTISGGPATGQGPTFVLTPTATTTYTIGTVGTSCISSTQVTVTVDPAVVAATGPAVTTISNQGVTIGAAPVPGYTYNWSPATGLSSATAANPTVTLLNTGNGPITQTYTLTATNTATGCTGTGTVAVTVNLDPTLTFYNIVLPNSKTENDRLRIKNVQAYPGSTVRIYNRWGREVFATTNYNNDTNYWGTDPGVAPGVYYFLFRQADGATTKGWVEVIK